MRLILYFIEMLRKDLNIGDVLKLCMQSEWLGFVYFLYISKLFLTIFWLLLVETIS